MKKLFIKLLQRIADYIVERVENSTTEDAVKYWYELGMSLDRWCVNREIYLN